MLQRGDCQFEAKKKKEKKKKKERERERERESLVVQFSKLSVQTKAKSKISTPKSMMSGQKNVLNEKNSSSIYSYIVKKYE